MKRTHQDFIDEKLRGNLLALLKHEQPNSENWFMYGPGIEVAYVGNANSSTSMVIDESEWIPSQYYLHLLHRNLIEIEESRELAGKMNPFFRISQHGRAFLNE